MSQFTKTNQTTKEIAGAMSGSDTASSMMSVKSGNSLRSKLFRKRTRPIASSFSELVSTDEDVPSPKMGTPLKRGRGRPPTTGEYVGLAKERALRSAGKGQEKFLKAEDEVAVSAEIANAARREMTEVLNKEGRVESEKSTSSILNAVSTSLDVVQKVAMKSGNLKGTFQRALKDAVSTIKDSVETLGQRTVSEETAVLQRKTSQLEEDNVRLEKELVDLRKELAELRAQVTPKSVASRGLEAPSDSVLNGNIDSANSIAPQEELLRAIMVQVGSMMNARFENLEERLLPEKRLRPPLSADTRKTSTSTQQMAASPASTQTVQLYRPQAEKSKKSKKKKETRVPPTIAVNISEPVATTSTGTDGWTTVSRRKAKNARVPSTKPISIAQKKQMAARPKAVRVPSSSAVVLQLQPAAIERGVTYASVLSEASEKIDAADLNVQFRKAASGARILRVPGTSSGPKANALAEKIRNAMGDVLKVSVPIKCAEILMSGLDDSATPEAVAATIARIGECAPESVSVGQIREHGMSGGSVVLRVPVVAAKMVARKKILKVGLVSVKVRLLESRPTRCFRCLRIGHIAVMCTNEVDRSGLCFRCGEAGHHSKGCNADPHCLVCAAEGQAATHIVGAKVCRESAFKAKTGSRVTGKALSTAAPTTVTGNEEQPMSN